MGNHKSQAGLWLILGGVGLAVVLGIFWVLSAQIPAQPPAEDSLSLKAPGTMTIGDAGAPITVVEYSDFQCPFCALFANEIQPQLIDEFVRSGQIRFEFRHFPVLGEFSRLAALASMCAHEQQAFWAYHDALFQEVPELPASRRNRDTLVDIARRLRLDTGPFKACLDEERYADQVARDFEEARSLGIVGTPSFVINGNLLVGAHPVETWRQVVEFLTQEGS